MSSKTNYKQGFSCRGCLKKIGATNEKIYLFDAFIDSSGKLAECTTISDIFAKYTSLDVSKFDGYSAYLCFHCYKKLKDFHEFREICIASHLKCLRQKSKNDYATVAHDNAAENVHIKEEVNILDDYNGSFEDYSNQLKDHLDGSDEMLLEEANAFVTAVEEQMPKKDVTKTRLKQTSGPSAAIDGGVKVENEFEDVAGSTAGIKCTMCDKVFFKQHRYDGHVRMHLGLKQFKCDECGKEFCKWSSLRHHKSMQHTTEGAKRAEFICGVDDCGKAYPLKESLKKHIFSVHLHQHEAKKREQDEDNSAGIKCMVCDKVFFKQHRYDGHVRMHMGLKQFKCDECGKEFCKWNSLKRHKSVRHVVEGETKAEFICGVNDCGKVYPLKESLKKHIQCVHLNQRGVKKKDRKMVCEQCGKAFESISGLTRHSYTHSGDKPFKCHLCPKQYPTKYKLKEHIMRHEGIKNHVCPTCGLRKTTMHELRVHMNYHTREKTFPCTMCPLVLPTSSRLNTHMKVVHYGIKEFHCTFCDRSFGKPDTLKHHIMTHTGEKPHECNVCGKRFIQPVALRTHMKTHTKMIRN